HTAGHISYFFPADNLAFVGDTLFSIGCGRVIEGTAEMMWQSLLKLRALPDDTRIYCGHEYTKANIRFAKTVEPGNAALKARETEVEKLLATGQPTIPSTMRAEKAANPFLRADLADVASSVGLAGSPAWKGVAEIRERKNRSELSGFHSFATDGIGSAACGGARGYRTLEQTSGPGRDGSVSLSPPKDSPAPNEGASMLSAAEMMRLLDLKPILKADIIARRFAIRTR